MRRLILLVSFGLLLIATAPGVAVNSTDFTLSTALNRIPMTEWDTIAFTDFTRTLRQLNPDWEPNQDLSEEQLIIWNQVWKPSVFELELNKIGVNAYQIERAIEARRNGEFAIWLEGNFNLDQFTTTLPALNYIQLADFPAEAYTIEALGRWHSLMPYVTIPNGDTLLIASSEESLQQLLDIYDGLSNPIVRENDLLNWLGEVSVDLTSAALRLDSQAQGCDLAGSQVTAHGLRYNTTKQDWEYILAAGYPSEVVITSADTLTQKLEFSTFSPVAYEGVLGQHTEILQQDLLKTNLGSLLQFVLDLRPNLEALPFELAKAPNPCVFFSSPPASAAAHTLEFIPDLSAGRLDITIRYGNSEQALYNAGLNPPLVPPFNSLTPQQSIALNSTWRTDLAYETALPEWFGLTADEIYQAIEITMNTGEYSRIIWGDFSTASIETALDNTGYVAVEQYNGVRVFTLREAPAQGGFLLESLSRTAASPQDGVLIFTNQIVNMRLTLDLLKQTFRSSLPRTRELLLTARALEDSTTVTLRRFYNPLSGGLVCGLPPYKVIGFANVLRPDGWYFMFAVGITGQLENPQAMADAIGEVLEVSDYPLQGPGSQTFGELSTVTETRFLQDNSATILVVEIHAEGTDQQSSFLGQDFAQASLPPCALGDITR